MRLMKGRGERENIIGTVWAAIAPSRWKSQGCTCFCIFRPIRGVYTATVRFCWLGWRHACLHGS